MEQPPVFAKKVSPMDVKLGKLNDTWFISAVATLAEKPKLIERLFLTKNYSDEGIYRLKLCKNGVWSTVTIDDYAPCSEEGGPIFSKTRSHDLWLTLLEKAYAKVHGNYHTLRGGFTAEALMDLTGCPTEVFDFEEASVQELVKT